MSKKIKLHIDDKPYIQKPSGNDVKYTLSKSVVQSVSEVTPQELAENVGEKGHTAVLGLMNGKRNKNNLIEQHLVALDFDNQDDNKNKTEGLFYQSIEDTLQDSFIKENASFIYKTFSHSEDWERFRVVFILDEPLQNNKEVSQAYKFLMNKFPNTDKGNKDSSRIFYGGSHKAIEVDYNNTLSKDTLGIEKSPGGDYKHSVDVEGINQHKQDTSVRSYARERKVPTYRIITDKTIPYPDKIKTVASRWEKYGKGKVFANTSGVFEFVRQLPMAELLDVTGNPFINILNHEENPSASIWIPEDTTTNLYTEFNNQGKNGNNRSYDLIQVVQKLLHKGNKAEDSTRAAAMQFLIRTTGIKVELTEELSEIHRQADEFKDILLSGTLKKQHPEMYKVFGKNNYIANVNAIIDIFKSNVYKVEETGEIESLHWGKIENLALRLSVSDGTAENLVNLMALTGIARKLPDEELSENLLKKLKKNKTHFKKDGEFVERKVPRERRSTVYDLNELDTNFQK